MDLVSRKTYVQISIAVSISRKHWATAAANGDDDGADDNDNDDGADNNNDDGAENNNDDDDGRFAAPVEQSWLASMFVRSTKKARARVAFLFRRGGKAESRLCPKCWIAKTYLILT